LRERGRVRSTVQKPTGPPIHIHITNTPFGSTGGNVSTTRPFGSLKRRLSSASESSLDGEESLSLADVVTCLDKKYPQLALLQYLPILKDQGIVYADSVGSFEKDYYIGLGMPEGAVGPFLSGVKKALKSERKKKRSKYFEKENNYNREESIEV
jgi:hypothetical protein